MKSVGAMALGVVWGWLLTPARHLARRSLVRLLVLGLMSATLGLEVHLLASGSATMVFAGAAMLGVVLHMEWRRALRRRFGMGRRSEQV